MRYVSEQKISQREHFFFFFTYRKDGGGGEEWGQRKVTFEKEKQ